MRADKLTCRFHDPNPAAVTAAHILNLFMEANAGKVEEAVQRAAARAPGSDEEAGGRSA